MSEQLFWAMVASGAIGLILAWHSEEYDTIFSGLIGWALLLPVVFKLIWIVVLS